MCLKCSIISQPNAFIKKDEKEDKIREIMCILCLGSGPNRQIQWELSLFSPSAASSHFENVLSYLCCFYCETPSLKLPHCLVTKETLFFLQSHLSWSADELLPVSRPNRQTFTGEGINSHKHTDKHTNDRIQFHTAESCRFLASHCVCLWEITHFYMLFIQFGIIFIVKNV